MKFRENLNYFWKISKATSCIKLAYTGGETTFVLIPKYSKRPKSQWKHPELFLAAAIEFRMSVINNGGVAEEPIEVVSQHAVATFMFSDDQS